MCKIGIIGGSFDPIHLGHTKLIKEALIQLQLDSFFVIPTGNNPWKDTSYASANDRLAMLNIALRDIDKVVVNTIELYQTEKNYTIDTLRVLKKQYPNDEFYYIMGMDQVSKFHLWKEAKEISTLVKLIAFQRVGYTKNENLNTYGFQLLNMEPMDISSSAIRLGDIESLDKEVLEYLVNHGIYLDTMIQTKMSKKRYTHTCSMALLARELAKSNGIDETKAYVAGMLHDIAKEMDSIKARAWMEKNYPMYLDKPEALWHQWISQDMARDVYLVKDAEILQAIRHHTTASTNMSLLDMCIYVADKYDPSRAYDSSKEIALCKLDIVEGFKQCLKDFYEFSKKNNRKIDPIFYEVYNTYCKGENI